MTGVTIYSAPLPEGPEAIVLAPDGQFPARPDARLQLLPVFDGYSLCVCTKDAARVALREL